MDGRRSLDLSRPSRVLLGLLSVLLVAGGIRLELLAARSLWVDEAFSLHIAASGPGQIVNTSRHSEPHPPGYYLLLWGWQRLAGSGFVLARLPSVFFGLLAVLLTWFVGRSVWGDWAGLAAAAVVAFHPFQVFASNEVRMYALLTAAGLAATFALLEAIQDPQCTRKWLLYGVLAAAVGYVSYYGFLLLVGHAAGAGVWAARSRTWRGPAVAVGVALLCYAPWLPWLLPSATSNPVPWRPPVSWSYPLGLLATQTFGGHLLGSPAYHGGGPVTVQWLALAVSFAVVLAVGLARSARGEAGSLVLATAWLVPVALVVAASVLLNKEVAYYYHLTYLQPYAALMLVSGVSGIAGAFAGSRRNVVALLGLALMLVVVGAAAHVVQTGSREVYRFDLAARWLERHRRKKEDVTIYFLASGSLVLHHYYKPSGPEVAIHADPRRWTLEETRPLLEKGVEPLRPKHKRVWLVLTPPFPPGSVQELVRLLEGKGYRPAPTGVAFGGVALQLFERSNR